jgi:2-succinyl-6-hydroxy-2,4-cyclohexadiene-1-carboxylate synthase (EC 2.5.1.64)
VLHVDERGAAFAALGVGRAARGPAAWVTTSGTAVANGLPAAVEASVDGVPMLLLTADRPPELRDTGANQTIDQVKIFGDYVRWQADVPPPSDEVDPAYVLTTADQALHQTLRAPAGPVHVNCMFRKPLEPVETEASVAVPTAVDAWAGAPSRTRTTRPPLLLRPAPRSTRSLRRYAEPSTGSWWRGGSTRPRRPTRPDGWPRTSAGRSFPTSRRVFVGAGGSSRSRCRTGTWC